MHEETKGKEMSPVQVETKSSRDHVRIGPRTNEHLHSRHKSLLSYLASVADIQRVPPDTICLRASNKKLWFFRGVRQ
jgi:hypothetical protein